MNQIKRESLHPDESQNCKNQSCSSNYMPSNAASKSFFIWRLQTSRHLQWSHGRPIFELRSERSVSQSDHIIWEMNIPNVCSDKTYRQPRVYSYVFERPISHRKIGVSPCVLINFLEKHGKFSFIIGHFERWSGTIKTLPHTRSALVT